MEVLLAKKEDAQRIALIHQQEIGRGFLSSLPIAFLTKFYAALITSPVSFCVVAKEGGQVIGFIAGVADIKRFQKYFLRAYFFSSLVILSKKFLSITFVKRALETLLYPTKETELPRAELLTMAVTRQFQGQGVAGVMLQEFLSQMRGRNTASFKVLAGQELESANRFYQRNGFVKVKETTLHDNKTSNVYIFNL